LCHDGWTNNHKLFFWKGHNEAVRGVRRYIKVRGNMQKNRQYFLKRIWLKTFHKKVLFTHELRSYFEIWSHVSIDLM
jgi:hypothetical protein